jgi:hypothetical protein
MGAYFVQAAQTEVPDRGQAMAADSGVSPPYQQVFTYYMGDFASDDTIHLLLACRFTQYTSERTSGYVNVNIYDGADHWFNIVTSNYSDLRYRIHGYVNANYQNFFHSYNMAFDVTSTEQISIAAVSKIQIRITGNENCKTWLYGVRISRLNLN